MVRPPASHSRKFTVASAKSDLLPAATSTPDSDARRLDGVRPQELALTILMGSELDVFDDVAFS